MRILKEFVKNIKASSDIGSLAVGITIFVIVLAYAFAPIGLTATESRNTVNTYSYTITNNTMTTIAPDTMIHITNTAVDGGGNNSASEADFTIYYHNAVDETVTGLNGSTPTTYTIGTSSLVLNLTDIQTANTAATVRYNTMYGTGSTGTTIFNALVPIVLAAIVLIVVIGMRRR